MRATILDGSAAGDTVGQRVGAAVEHRLEAIGWSVGRTILREKTIAPCAGDLGCWVQTPGVCRIDDDNRPIAEAVARSDLLVCLTPVTFGGYSSILKRMVDHLIQNFSLSVTEIDGEVHTGKRYEANPDLLAVGWLDEPDAQAETVFRHLIQRNALNMHAGMHAGTHVSAVVAADVSDGALEALVREATGDVIDGRSTPPSALPAQLPGSQRIEVRRALLLVGSPMSRSSTSHSLGSYLHEQLVDRSIGSRTVFVHQAMRSATKTDELIDAVDEVDLVTLAFPLHIDSLPAPLTEMLEMLAAHRRGSASPTLLAAIVNSGMPESHQSATALAICRLFAQRAGFAWAGSLVLGSGNLVVGGGTLTEDRHAPIRKALGMAASELAEGHPIPDAAQELMGR